MDNGVFFIQCRRDKKTKRESSWFQRVDKPSHSLSGLRVGAHESNIRSAPMLGFPRLQWFSITLG
ncbi:hypothetical protein COP00_01660 [Bacillus glycinifermentans]|nr:hypothetical protein COP00_01660 [Bacillus glycinifermentans]